MGALNIRNLFSHQDQGALRFSFSEASSWLVDAGFSLCPQASSWLVDAGFSLCPHCVLTTGPPGNSHDLGVYAINFGEQDYVFRRD